MGPAAEQHDDQRDGRRSLLVPGAKVMVTAQDRNGTPTALRALAGRNGFAPPM